MAANRTLSIGRSYAKEILNSMRLPQSNLYAVCKACRGLNLEDSWRIKQDGDQALVTFEEFKIFCGMYGMNAYQEAAAMDRESYLKMQIADYILNNNDRHEQNWGFFMDNSSGKIVGYCPLFDHDHAFTNYDHVMSQTTEEPAPLYEAAAQTQREIKPDLSGVKNMEKPALLTEKQWFDVLARVNRLE